MNPTELGGGEGSRVRQSFETSTTYNSLRTSHASTREQPRGQGFRPDRGVSAPQFSAMRWRLIAALLPDPEVISPDVLDSDTWQLRPFPLK